MELTKQKNYQQSFDLACSARVLLSVPLQYVLGISEIFLAIPKEYLEQVWLRSLEELEVAISARQGISCGCHLPLSCKWDQLFAGNWMG